jgi:integrase
VPDGKKVFYYRYFVGTKKRFVQLGDFNPKGKKSWDGSRGGGLSLAAAKDGAKSLADIVTDHGDIESYERQQEQQKALENSRGSFGQLLEVYTQFLTDSARASAKSVAGTLALHVINAHPLLIPRKANEITPGDIQFILARLVQQGKTRQVNLLRSHLQAAFNYAAKHDNDPRRVAAQAVAFNLTSNPVSLIPQIADFNRTGDRSLNREELLLLLAELDSAPLIPASFIRLLVALGGQRIEQLLRAEWADYDFDARVLTLRDSKGRPGLGVRDHLVPLTNWAIEILEPLRELNSNAHPFTSVGRTRMDVGTPTKLINKISARLHAKHGIEPFRGGDIRRTCETLLASIGISKEVRAQLLSHGRSTGVQARHYDRYAYLPEKLEALEKWRDFLA